MAALADLELNTAPRGWILYLDPWRLVEVTANAAASYLRGWTERPALLLLVCPQEPEFMTNCLLFPPRQFISACSALFVDHVFPSAKRGPKRPTSTMPGRSRRWLSRNPRRCLRSGHGPARFGVEQRSCPDRKWRDAVARARQLAGLLHRAQGRQCVDRVCRGALAGRHQPGPAIEIGGSHAPSKREKRLLARPTDQRRHRRGRRHRVRPIRPVLHLHACRRPASPPVLRCRCRWHGGGGLPGRLRHAGLLPGVSRPRQHGHQPRLLPRALQGLRRRRQLHP